MRTALFLSFVAAATSLTSVACGPSALPDGERRQSLGVIGKDVALPNLQTFSERADALDSACQTLSNDPTQPNLDAARDAWKAARDPWMQNLVFGFGPVADDRLDAAIDQQVDVNRIEETLKGDGALDADAVADLGANRKGFHTLEWLLFLDPDGTTVLQALTDETSGERRRAYATGVATGIATSAHTLEDDWSPSGQDYLGRLTKPGAEDAAFTTVKASLDAIVNQAVFLSELVFATRIGGPLGTANGGTPRPELEESPWADASVTDMQGALVGIRNAYYGTANGKPGRGFSTLIAARSPGADLRVRAALKDALEKVAAIPAPFHDAVENDQDTVQAAYDAVRTLKRTLTTEVVILLGATLKFNDNDGD